MTLLGVLGIVALALLGAPLYTIIGGAAFFSLWTIGSENYWETIIKLIDINTKPELTTIPLFTLAGYLMAESNTPRRLVNLANALFGWLPGGLAIACLVCCSFFTAFTGASGVTIVALGILLYPILLKEQYPHDFSLGLITSSGNMGLLFPPSLPIIVYGIVAGAAIDHLFIAGILPGLLLMLIFGSYCMISASRANVARQPFKVREALRALRGAFWELPLPVIILGGIYGGFFAPLQAAAVTAFYVLLIEVFVYRDLHPTRDLPRIMREGMTLIGGILVILAAACGFTDFLITEQIPDKLFASLAPYLQSQWTFLVLLNLFLLVVGCMMDIFSAIFVVVPLIVPFAHQYHIDPVHLGIIFLANLGIGYTTPPVGMNLFIASLAFKEPMAKLYRVAIPFLIMMIAAQAVITYVPALSLGPLDWLGIRKMEVATAPADETGQPSAPAKEESLLENTEGTGPPSAASATATGQGQPAPAGDEESLFDDVDPNLLKGIPGAPVKKPDEKPKTGDEEESLFDGVAPEDLKGPPATDPPK